MRKVSDASSSSDEESAQEAAIAGPDGIDQALVKSMRAFFLDLWHGKKWWVQCITIYIAAFFTYSYDNVGGHSTNIQIAVMTVITIFGASPFKSHLVPAAIGAFVGGQNIILATSDNENTIYPINYLWLFLLSVVVGLVWCFFIMPNKILDGSGGRLGTTTFIGMNITMLLFFGPLGVVQWEVYLWIILHCESW